MGEFMAGQRKSQRNAWPPLSVSRGPLPREGRDDDFRRMVEGMVEFASVLQRIRDTLSQHLGVSTPQYAMLMLLARQEAKEVTTTQLAALLHVSLAFVVTESSKLAAAGWIARRRNPADARSVLISLTEHGRQTLSAAAPLICQVNDRLFAPLTRRSMTLLTQTILELLDSSKAALEAAAPLRCRKSSA